MNQLPLSGVRVIELAGLAPGPFAGLVLQDFGADVIRIDRIDTNFNSDILARGKRSIALSLKTPEGVALLKTLLSASAPSSESTTGCSNPKCKCSTSKISNCSNNMNNKKKWTADILIDPFRPGVLEKLGFGPDVLLKLNPRLIIARLTGFRREGVFSKMSGHDINYIALSGVLSMLGRKGEKPYFPGNLLADFAGGGIIAVVGILMALLERNNSNKGQVVEIDMVTGTRYISSFPLMMARPSLDLPIWNQTRGENYLDGGCPWYNVYETSDEKYMSVGALEPQFYREFLTRMIKHSNSSLIPNPPPSLSDQLNRETWPILSTFLTKAFLTKSRQEWTNIFLGTDACCVPVLNRNEVDSFGLGFDEVGGNGLSKKEISSGDGSVPIPAPKLSRTPATPNFDVYQKDEFFLEPGKDTREILSQIGISSNEVENLIKIGAIAVGITKSKL